MNDAPSAGHRAVISQCLNVAIIDGQGEVYELTEDFMGQMILGVMLAVFIAAMPIGAVAADTVGT